MSASTPATTGIAPFMDLMGQVMSKPEYKDAPRVFVIVDNGSDHRGQAAVDRLHDAPERHHDPHPGPRILAESVEIFFSIIQKKVISPTTLPPWVTSSRPCSRSHRYNQAARPFNWKFTTADLARRLRHATGSTAA